MWKSAEKGLTNNIGGSIQSRDEIPGEKDSEVTKAT